MTGPLEIRQVLDSFRSIVQALRMDGRDVVRGARLSSAQLFALQRIAEHPSASINDIAALTFTQEYELTTRSNVALEGAAFLDQERSTFDRISNDVARTVVTAILEAF